MNCLILLSLAVAGASAIVCLPETCANANCQAVTAENCPGRIVINGGFCGCCDLCIVSLAQGEHCMPRVILGVVRHGECAHGLVCDHQSFTCKVQPSTELTCLEQRQQILNATDGMPPFGQFIPRCNDDGSFAFRQCHGSVCYCVDSHGHRIPYYSGHIGDATMDCQCARDQSDYMQTGLIGRLFNCTVSGSYQH